MPSRPAWYARVIGAAFFGFHPGRPGAGARRSQGRGLAGCCTSPWPGQDRLVIATDVAPFADARSCCRPLELTKD